MYILLQCVDVDSDAEKLSPLLVVKKADPIPPAEHSPLQTDETVRSARGEGDGHAGAEDSDYYTPDEPNPSTLSPLYEPDKVFCVQGEYQVSSDYQAKKFGACVALTNGLHWNPLTRDVNNHPRLYRLRFAYVEYLPRIGMQLPRREKKRAPKNSFR